MFPAVGTLAMEVPCQFHHFSGDTPCALLPPSDFYVHQQFILQIPPLGNLEHRSPLTVT